MIRLDLTRRQIHRMLDDMTDAIVYYRMLKHVVPRHPMTQYAQCALYPALVGPRPEEMGGMAG